MRYETELSRELKLRQDCVQADYERLKASGSNTDALDRLVEHSLQIGIIFDKLNNMRIHQLLSEETDDD